MEWLNKEILINVSKSSAYESGTFCSLIKSEQSRKAAMVEIWTFSVKQSIQYFSLFTQIFFDRKI